MADWETTSHDPGTAEVPDGTNPATDKWHRVITKWRGLVEQRQRRLLDLYKKGRWQDYYTDEEFLVEMREAVAIAERWAKTPFFETTKAPAGTGRGVAA